MSWAATAFAVRQRHQQTAARASAHTAIGRRPAGPRVLRAWSGAASGYSARWWQPRLSLRANAAAATARAVTVSATSSKSRTVDNAAHLRRAEDFGKRRSPAASRTTDASRVIARCSARRFGAVWAIGSGAVARDCPARRRVGGGGLSGPATDHQTFQQAVGRQAVRAVHPGAGHLARGEQPGQLGSAVHVGDDAAAAVVRAGNDRNRLTHRVDAGRPACGGDGREAGREAVDPARVEVDARIAGRTSAARRWPPPPHRGRQVAHRMNARGHRIALPVNAEPHPRREWPR